MPPISIRRARVADIGVLIADVQAGFDSYVEFAPLGWVPPDVDGDRELMEELMNDGGTWAAIAMSRGKPLGHIAFTPARRRAPGKPWATSPSTPGLAHLWQLFILPPWWGQGVAPILHDAGVEEMRARGYRTGRLYTPALHARARRFYERRGWRAIGEQWNEHLALMLTEYRLAL